MSDLANPCPFCGFRPEVSDDDFCYPSNRELTYWTANCYMTGGGCGAEGPPAKNRDDAIRAWNQRQYRD